MTKNDFFALRISEEDRRNIEVLARHLNRSQADAIRYMVRVIVHEIELREPFYDFDLAALLTNLEIDTFP